MIPATRTVVARDKRKRILIVEDEFLIACECEFILSEADHEVVGIAAGEQEAIRLAGESRPDLVLMDIRLLHGGDGIKAAQAILERCGIRCIFMSAHGEPETRARGALARPVGWLTKPYTGGTLLAAIDRADLTQE